MMFSPKEMDQVFTDWLVHKIDTLRSEDSREVLTVYLNNCTRICFSRWTDGDFSVSVVSGNKANVSTFTIANYEKVSVEAHNNVITVLFMHAGMVEFDAMEVFDII